MVQDINPEILVDETGIKKIQSVYTCAICKKKFKYKDIFKKKLHYKLLCKESELISFEKGGIRYTTINKVIYICYKDFKKLPDIEKKTFVLIGTPYFLSLLPYSTGVYSF